MESKMESSWQVLFKFTAIGFWEVDCDMGFG